MAGLWGSQQITQIPELFRVVEDPFSGGKVVAVKALRPDYAILHVQEADEFGNARISGPDYQDILLTRASNKTILTTEKIVSTDSLKKDLKSVTIPHFLVAAVVELPGGAKPCTCFDLYDTVDPAGMKAYQAAVKGGTVQEYMANAVDNAVKGGA